MIKEVVIIIICLTLILPLNQISFADSLEPKNSFSEKQSNTLFSSNIDIETESLPSTELRTGQTIGIQLTIKFETNIPRSFLLFMPWQIRNLILYNQIIAPPQTIHLEIENHPEFALIDLAQDTIRLSWVSDGTTMIHQTIIYITLLEAPKAEPFSFQVRAYCEDFGKISGDETIETFTFNLPWEPNLKIKKYDYIISAPAGSLVNTTFSVTNEGNDDCLVLGETTNENSSWSTCLSPCYHIISKNDTEKYTYFIGIPKNCIHCLHTFQIDFTSINIHKTNTTSKAEPVFISVFSLEP